MKSSRDLRLGLLLAALGLVGAVVVWRHFSFAARRPAATDRPFPTPWAAAPGRRMAADPAGLSWAERDARMHRLLRALQDVETGDDAMRDRLLAALAAFLTDANAAEIVRSLTPEELRTDFGRAALARWLQADCWPAAEWIAAQPGADPESAALVARRLVAFPTGLNRFCDQLPAGAFRQELLLEAGLQVVAQDPAEALALAQRLTPDAGQTNLLQTLAYDWTTRDPEGALAWMMKVDDPALRETLVAMGAKAIAGTDPELATHWLAAGVRSPELLQDTALRVVEIWVAQAPAAAAGWVGQFPAGASRQSAVDLVLRRWLETDPAAAHAWILDLPERESILNALRTAQSEPSKDASSP